LYVISEVIFEISYMCVLGQKGPQGVSIFPLSTVFLLDFGTVWTLWYFVIFFFHFIITIAPSREATPHMRPILIKKGVVLQEGKYFI